MKPIEGSCFGFQQTGLFDSAIFLLQKLVLKDDYFLELFLCSGLWEVIFYQLNPTKSANELSPNGLLTATRIIYDVIAKNTAEHINLVVVNNFLAELVAILDISHLELLSDWPSALGGSIDAVCSLVTQVVSIFYLPFANKMDNVNILPLVQQIMINYKLVQNIIASLPFLSGEFLELPLGLLSRLVHDDNNFARQFIEFGGLEPTIVEHLLKPSNLSGVLIDTLGIISQLARISKDNYQHMNTPQMYNAWKELLTHKDPNITAKMCNLIGNLCRHSAFFYGELARYDIMR
jgi:fused-like protein